MRLIDADELIKNLQEMADLEWNQQVGSSKGIEDAIDVIENFPAVEDRQIGKWVKSPCLDYGYCSECSFVDYHWYDHGYCANCGARMKGSDSDA